MLEGWNFACPNILRKCAWRTNSSQFGWEMTKISSVQLDVRSPTWRSSDCSAFQTSSIFTGRKKLKSLVVVVKKSYDGVSWILVNITHTYNWFCCCYEIFALKRCTRLYFCTHFKRSQKLKQTQEFFVHKLKKSEISGAILCQKSQFCMNMDIFEENLRIV